MNQDLRTRLIRLGSTNPELRPHIRPILKTANWKVWQDAGVDQDALSEEFHRLSRVWPSGMDAESALMSLLRQEGLTVSAMRPRPYGRDGDWAQWTLTKDRQELGHINVFQRPGPRPRWVSFQVSF